ncbi:MAG: HAMP domain-containing sensor histidine kinase [Prolixibacteraceae bacterium]
METKYAPAERESISEILKSKSSLESIPFLNEVFCSLSYIFCILNEKRQVVFANDVMMKNLGIVHLDQVLGKRFGEAFECVYSKVEPGGCGTSDHCRYCGAVNVMIQSSCTNSKITKECRLRRMVDGIEASIEIEVTASPFNYEGKDYTIFSLIDITDRKRRGLLERIFFHDILNTAGGLSNVFELLDIVDEEEKGELMHIGSSLSQQIIDEITTQRLLLQAESASLIVNNQRINSFEFLDVVKSDLKYHEVAKNKDIVLDQHSDCLFFVSDPVILRKILNNMIKNALEAIEVNETVTIKVKKLGDKVRFSVHNKTFMPKDVEMQVFMRSFSTKGVQRGLGTYSMKVLGEQYLGGIVNFTTDPVKGTTFFIDLGGVELD